MTETKEVNQNKNGTGAPQIFTLRYKKDSGAVKELNFESNNINTAKKDAQTFCSKHGFTFIYAQPFLTDLLEERKKD